MITWTQGHAIAALLLLGILLVACQPEKVTVEVPVEVTRVVTETAIEEGETVEVTRVVTEEVIVEVTAEPEPDEEVVFADPSPGTLIQLAFGDIDTMDPAISYDTASGQLLENVMEGLIYFNHKSSIDYVPALATEVPSLENGGISEDGLTYTWKIRAGVKFHEGGDLTPSDVAYSMQRALLQSDPNGPMWLWIEPFMGGGAHDITEWIDEGA